MTEAQRSKLAREIASVWFSEVEDLSLSDQMTILASVAMHCGRIAGDKSNGKIHPVVALCAAKNRLINEMDRIIQFTKR